jgi:hypothetical protein
MSSFGSPAWTVLIGDLVPPRRRAPYFGDRHRVIMPAAPLVAPLAGSVYIWLSARPLVRTHTMPPSPAGVELAQGGRS